jgi:hypothetical protein
MLRSIGVSCGVGGCVTDNQEAVEFRVSYLVKIDKLTQVAAKVHSFASTFALHSCSSGMAGSYGNWRADRVEAVEMKMVS